MAFQFQILGLFVMFLLIVMYFNNSKYMLEKYNVYKILLGVGYIMEVLYIITFIGMKSNFIYILFAKMYFVSVVLVSILFLGYFILSIWREVYKNNLDEVDKRLKNVKVIGTIFLIVMIFLIFISRVRVLDDIVRLVIDIPSICMEIVMLIQLIMLFKYYQKLEVKKAFCLLVMLIMQFVILGGHFYFDYLAVINSGYVMIILYLYIVIENVDRKENEILRIERDNALRNSLDKSNFLKNISHEIRTPINTIDGFSQVIMDSDNVDDIKEDIKDIRLASRDLVDIINGMIDLSIIQSGNLVINNEDYAFYDMIDNVKEITNSKIRDKAVKFSVEVDKDIPDILLGDMTRISQVLLNILTNSIKFTNKGSISLKVECVKSNNRCRLKFIITDTGRGISRDDINKIFDYDDSRENKGIGLVVSKYLVDLMNGKIEVSSEENKGSQFVITIDQDIVSEKRTDKFKKKTDIKPFDGSGKRVLIVDDNKLNLKVASKLLSIYKVEVIDANSGQECLDILDKDTNFDLILMDDLMPELSGSETLKILKKIERVDGYYIPVVVLTANAHTGMKEKYLDMGFDDYLAKPIEKEELDRILKEYIKK